VVHWWTTPFDKDSLDAIEDKYPREALEQAMRIESMAGYPINTKVVVAGTSPKLSQFQNQIAALTEQIKEFTKAKAGRDQV
jgi:hypothetical protein